MIQMKQIAELLFLGIAAWQDLKSRSIAVWVYFMFGVVAIVFWVGIEMSGWKNWMELGASMGIGLVICVLSRLTRGAIGMGDGCFFVVTGIFLGLNKNFSLLCFGLLLCGLYSLGIYMWGIVLGVDMRKRSLPFLPFLLVPGIWMVLL